MIRNSASVLLRGLLRGLLAAMVVSMSAGSVCVFAEQNQANRPVTIETGRVVREQRIIPIRTSGRLAFKTETRLAFKTSGLVSEVTVDVGDRFVEGKILAALDLAELDARVASDTSSVKKAARDLRRFKDLYKKKVIALQQLENAQTALQVAQSSLNIARFNRRLSVITAPFPGRVLKRKVEVNELVNSGVPVYVVASEEQGWVVRVGLADRDVVRVKVGDAAELAMDAYPGETLHGEISQIAESADIKTGTFEVEISVKSDDKALRSGFFVRVDILPASTPTYAYIPIEALVTAKDMKGLVFAYDRKTKKVSKKSIEIVDLVDTELAVKSGLEGVKWVVTEGALYMKDGLRVQLAH